MLKKTITIFLTIILITPRTFTEKKKLLKSMIDKLPGCDPSSPNSAVLHEELQLSLITECENLLTCALSKSKNTTKDNCLDKFEIEMQKACYPQAKKFSKDDKLCLEVIQINNTYSNFISHDFFTESKKKFQGFIKYYEYPSFKEISDSQNPEIECYLGDLGKGKNSDCENERNFFTFYELENGKFIIENSMKVSEFVGVTQCVKGMENPELDICDFGSEDQQYDVRVLDKGEQGEEGFVENFGEFLEVVVIRKFEDI